MITKLVIGPVYHAAYRAVSCHQSMINNKKYRYKKKMYNKNIGYKIKYIIIIIFCSYTGKN